MANVELTPVLLTGTATLARTINGASVAEVVRLDLCNHDTVDRIVSVWFKPSAETLGNQHRVLHTDGNSKLKPGEPFSLLLQANLQAGDEIYWAADAANVVSAQGSVLEVTKNGHENFDAQYLTTSISPFYTVDSGTAGKEATAISIVLCNQSPSTRLGVELQFVTQGGSPTNKFRIRNETEKLEAGETQVHYLPARFLQAGTTIQAKAEAGSTVAIYGAIFEELIA